MGLLHWRVPLGGIKMGSGRHRKNPMKGFPDIAGLTPGGRLFVIEVKREKGGILSDAQQVWLDNLRDAGAKVIVATSLEDVQHAFNYPLDGIA